MKEGPASPTKCDVPLSLAGRLDLCYFRKLVKQMGWTFAVVEVEHFPQSPSIGELQEWCTPKFCHSKWTGKSHMWPSLWAANSDSLILISHQPLILCKFKEVKAIHSLYPNISCSCWDGMITPISYCLWLVSCFNAVFYKNRANSLFGILSVFPNFLWSGVWFDNPFC